MNIFDHVSAGQFAEDLADRLGDVDAASRTKTLAPALAASQVGGIATALAGLGAVTAPAVVLSQAAYDAIGVKNSGVLYFIVG